jgi:multidrug efflux pump subunit AcrB
VQDFPDIELPIVTVTAALEGAAPAQLETEVARKIEDSVASLQGVKNIYNRAPKHSSLPRRREPMLSLTRLRLR